ncbi:MAG: CotH kinase family protein [Saprospiraceae bacterium]
MKNILIIIFTSLSVFCLAQTLAIQVPEKHLIKDDTNLLIISHIENINSFVDLSNYSEISISSGNNIFHFNTLPNSLEYSRSYLVRNTSNEYTLYFTQLPIISIETTSAIIDEPKVLAEFTYADDDRVIESFIGIELRGVTSLSYPKKTYGLEFWKDEKGEETLKVQFGKLRNDDDWILDALYNEPLRLRSYVANKLWLNMHNPFYQQDEPNAKSGANVQYVEVFVNNEYTGIYNLSERIDKKQLKLKSYKNNIRGELYKGVSWGASTFTSLPNFNNNDRTWSGYELKYPRENEITEWQNIYSFTDFVLNSSDADFVNNVWSKFNYENFLDYFIFLNLLRATDNTGKNIYIAKYNTAHPYFYIPWDLDGCFGTIWNGTNENITNDILTNGFLKRVINLNPNDYSKTLSNKWFEYRDNILEENKLMQIFENQYQYFLNNKIYERESIVYPNSEFKQQDLAYLLNWLHNRISFLDEYFRKVLTVGNMNLTKTEMLFYPNPARNIIYILATDKLVDETYEIYNNLGNLIDQSKIENNFISIEALKPGSYIVIINKTPHKIIVK